MLPDGWKETRLGKCVDIKSGVAPSSLPLKRNGKYPYVKVEDMNNCSKFQKESREYTDYNHNHIRSGAVIFPKRGAAIMNNKVRISINGIYLDSNMMALQPNSETTSEFLYYLITFCGLFKIADTSTIPQINNKHILPYPILLPPLPEQKKIAAILSTWDHAIEGTEKLLANSQQQKKALMQQLLTGKKRLPGFMGEWKLSTLAACCKPQQWATISSKDLTFSGFPVYGANGFIGYFSEYNHQNDTVTVTCRGSTCGTVSLIKGPSYITGNSMCLDQVKKDCSHIYLYYYLNHRGLKDIISGSAQPQIVGKAIQKVSVRLPLFLEQKAIASVLTTMDEEIAAIESDLSRLRQEKKALMQQLLTGKRRVKVD